MHRPLRNLPVAELTLRESREADRQFLVALYASTREAELAATGWNAAERDAFVRMQFDLQDRHYRAAFPHADHSLILRSGRPVGRLIVDRGRREIRVIDISLVPDQRGCGIGSTVLQRIMADAALAGVPVGLSVDVANPARRLYDRLGFVVTETSGFHLLLQWRPSTTPA